MPWACDPRAESLDAYGPAHSNPQWHHAPVQYCFSISGDRWCLCRPLDTRCSELRCRLLRIRSLIPYFIYPYPGAWSGGETTITSCSLGSAFLDLVSSAVLIFLLMLVLKSDQLWPLLTARPYKGSYTVLATLTTSFLNKLGRAWLSFGLTVMDLLMRDTPPIFVDLLARSWVLMSCTWKHPTKGT